MCPDGWVGSFYWIIGALPCSGSASSSDQNAATAGNVPRPQPARSLPVANPTSSSDQNMAPEQASPCCNSHQQQKHGRSQLVGPAPFQNLKNGRKQLHDIRCRRHARRRSRSSVRTSALSTVLMLKRWKLASWL